MARPVYFAVALVGCGAPPPLSPTRPTVPAPAAALPAAPRAVDFDVVGADLGEPGVLGKIPHRVRIARLGKASTSIGGTRFGDVLRTLDSPLVFAVLGESRDAIRVVDTQNHIRVALWIDRSDAAPTITAAVELDRESPEGAWLLPGAPISILSVHGDRRAVALNDPRLQVSGTIAARAIGDVWSASQPRLERDAHAGDRRYDPDASVEQLETGSWLEYGTSVHVEPDAASATIATVTQAINARLLARRGAFSEIEIDREFVRVRGFVAANEVHAGPPRDELESIGVDGYGTSGGRKLKIASGACLYDHPNGEVIGVELETEPRIAVTSPDHPGWYFTEIGVHWGPVPIYMHGSGDPQDPVWESCRNSL